MSNDNKQIVEQLYELQTLIYEAQEIKNYIEVGSVKEALTKIELAKVGRGEFPAAPSVFNNLPVFPTEKGNFAGLERSAKSRKKLFFGVLAVTVLLLMIYFITHNTNLNTFATIGVFASVITGLMYRSENKKYAERKKEYDASLSTFNKTMAAYKDSLANYESEKAKALDDMILFSAMHSVAYKDSTEALDCWVANKKEAAERYDATLEKTQTYDFMPVQYYHLISPIIDLLTTGRADSYKEALNMAIREEQEEKERAARIAAEERRTQILAQQAAEERRHNEQMERQQAAHDRAMENQAREQSKAAEKLAQKAAWDAKIQADKERRDRQNAEARTRSAGVARCASCANSKHCPSHIKNNGSGLTCGGYVPYGGR